ncbi:hypothetical protein N836_24485 [Leptolyngbya sp. Heron Island J]|nr:hypothetical protein N836_24485 [Leptolyngbya sp. Heron Island J]
MGDEYEEPTPGDEISSAWLSQPILWVVIEALLE